MSSNNNSESISTPGLPSWMKKRVDSRLDFESAAFTPPSHDDSFFYIRYPVSETKSGTSSALSGGLHPISEVLNENSGTGMTASFTNPGSSILGKQFTLAQPSAASINHTEQCKQYLGLPGKDAIAPPVIGVKGQKKPFGIDDGFNGQRSACSSSIVKVANQIVNGKPFIRGHTVSNISSDTIVEGQQVQQKKEQETIKSSDIGTAEDLKYLRQHQSMLRRGSKSLPASPVGSPKAMRKATPNPYFTGTFVATTNNSDKQNNRGWFLGSLLGYQREATTASRSQFCEDSDKQTSTTTQSSGSSSSSTATTQNTTTKHLKAKPSELREMNFWSPTSM